MDCLPFAEESCDQDETSPHAVFSTVIALEKTVAFARACYYCQLPAQEAAMFVQFSQERYRRSVSALETHQKRAIAARKQKTRDVLVAKMKFLLDEVELDRADFLQRQEQFFSKRDAMICCVHLTDD